MTKLVSYKGMLCELLEAAPPYPALLRIFSAKDIERAYQEGFACMGFPNEIVKEINDQDYQHLVHQKQDYKKEIGENNGF